MWSINVSHLCVAISGLSGCGNTSVSKLLAEVLGIAFINYTFRTLAEEEGMSFDDLRKLAERDDKWDYLVDQRQVEIAKQKPCVVGSRLAIWMVPFATFKVYLDADEEIRAERIHKRQGGDLEEILHHTHDRDLADQARYMNLYQINIRAYYDEADAIVNANNASVEEIVSLIVEQLEKKGDISRL